MAMHLKNWMSSGLVLGVLAVSISTGTVQGQVNNENVKILPTDGAANDYFGWSIAIDSGIVAIGACSSNDNGVESGSAYLFSASTGSQIFKLLPSDGAMNDYFGNSIAIDNGIVAVGAPYNNDNGTASGSAYLFDASTGIQIAKLLPSDGAAEDYFGYSIAISNGIVAVGALYDGDNGFRSGSAYLFDASTGQQMAKLLPLDGAADDRFGNSIAIDNGIVAVGAFLDNDNSGNSGSAYLFSAYTGTQIAKLLPTDGAIDDWFGYSIAIDNGVVAVGAKYNNDFGNDSGSAYLFNASTGAQIAKLLPSDGAADDWFGYSIAISNGVVAVGALLDDDNGWASGSAYLFDACTGIQVAKLLSSDGATNDYFSCSIDIDNGVVAVGVMWDGDNGIQSGSAYVFDDSCPADLTGDGVVDVLDYFAFVTAFAAGCSQ